MDTGSVTTYNFFTDQLATEPATPFMVTIYLHYYTALGDSIRGSSYFDEGNKESKEKRKNILTLFALLCTIGLMSGS